MSLATREPREFESAVPITAEQESANAAHFESKGLEYVVESGDGVKDKKPEDQPKPEDTAVPAAVAPPGDNVAPPEAGEVDEETKIAFAEAQRQTTDAEKLGWHARRTKRIREAEQKTRDLEVTTATQTALLAEKDREIERLLKAGTNPASATTQAPPAAVAASVTQPAAAPPEEEIKAKPFEKVAPKKPVFDDFKENDDPYKAFAEAGVQYAEDLSDWKLERERHNNTEEQEVRRLRSERDQQRSQVETVKEARRRRFDEAKAAHPDFDAVTNKSPMTGIMNHVLIERLKDGPEIGYQLGLPENKAIYDELFARTKKQMSGPELAEAVDDTLIELALFSKQLASRKSQTQPPQQQQSQPAAAAPPPPPASNAQLRREEAPSPAAVRGMATPGMLRPQDVDPEDSDARRDLKKKNGEMVGYIPVRK